MFYIFVTQVAKNNYIIVDLYLNIAWRQLQKQLYLLSVYCVSGSILMLYRHVISFKYITLVRWILWQLSFYRLEKLEDTVQGT